MALISWLAFISLISPLISVASNPSSSAYTLGADNLKQFTDADGVQIVPGWSLHSKFIIGGWDPIFSTLGPPRTGVGVHCHSEQYGSPNRHSCGEAFVDIPESREKIAFTDRNGQGSWDYRGPQPLPFRWVSCKLITFWVGVFSFQACNLHH